VASILDGSYLTDAWNNRHARSFSRAVAILRDEGYTVDAYIEQSVSALDVADVYARYQDVVGADVIITTNFAHRAGFLQYVATERGASQYFITGAALGAPNNRTFGIYGNIFAGSYLAGKACGLSTRTNNIGMIALAGMRGGNSYVNAFAVAARRVNPNVRIYMMQNNNSSSSAIVEARIASDMITQYGVDCILGGAFAPGAYGVVAQYPNVTAVGLYDDYRYAYGENMMFGIIYDWTALYLEGLRGYLNRTAAPGAFPGQRVKWGPLGTTITLTDFSTRIASNVYDEVQRTKARIIDRTECLFPWETVSTLYGAPGSESYMRALNATDAVLQEGDTVPTRCLSQLQMQSMPAYMIGSEHANLLINPYNLTIEQTLRSQFARDSDGGAIASYVIAAIGLLLCILLVPFVARYRDNQLIRASSPEFMFIIILGCGLMYASVFSYFGEPTTGTCQLRLWLFFPGLCTVTAALAFKNFRIWRIFANKSMSVFRIGTKELMLYGILPTLLIQVLLLVLWSAVNTYVAVRDATSPTLLPDQINIRCVSPSPWSLALVLAYNALLALSNVAIGIAVRDVPFDAYREARYILIATYNAIVGALVCLAVHLTVPYSPAVESYINVGTTLFISTGYLALVFGERVYCVLVLGRDTFGTSSSSDSNKLGMRSTSAGGTWGSGRNRGSSAIGSSSGGGGGATARSNGSRDEEDAEHRAKRKKEKKNIQAEKAPSSSSSSSSSSTDNDSSDEE
jgi:basic membrane lipoprotein Med (substrate-binding protein (PBP1-ABC) superfamily)/uncharacterized membrane protein YgcG